MLSTKQASAPVLPTSMLPSSPLSSTRGIVRSEPMTSSSIQQAFRQLASDPHFQPAGFEATIGGAASVSWTVACVGALFDAIYVNCISTDEDFSKVQCLSKEVKALEDNLRAKTNISSAERVFEEKSLTLAKRALEELGTLLSALEMFNPVRAKLNNATRILSDSIASLLYPGQELLFSETISQGVDALLELEKQIESLPKDSATRARLEMDFQKAIPPFLAAIQMWNKNVLAVIKNETQLLLSQLDKKETREDVARQLLALNTRQQEIYSELGTLITSLENHPKLASISDALKKESALIQKEQADLEQAIKSNKLPANLAPLEFGSDEWVRLIAKRPGKKLSFLDKVKWKMTHSKFWVAAPKRREQESDSITETKEKLPWLKRLMSIFKKSVTPPKPIKEEISPPSTFLETIQAHGQENLNDALATLAKSKEQIALDNSKITEELREEIITLQKELIRTAKHPPGISASLDDIADWKQEVSDKCYAVKRLEDHIAGLMKQARKVLSANDEVLDRYGKKHANNIRQARIATGLNLPGISVPLPYGNSSDEVKRFLEEYAPEVFTEREILRTLYDKYAESKSPSEPFLKQLEVVAHLKIITDAVTKAFKKAGEDKEVYNKLVSKEFIEWLDSVRANGDYLMVRSTGSEDTRQTANAGGNVSEAYVEATQAGFTEAAKDVLCSYFGVSSLQNQINVKINPFEGPPKLAITSQQLIGEAIGGSKDDKDVPISLVLFTAEPLYIGGENFRVMRISATYGHGEGVVGAQGVASDTALLLVSEANPDQLYVLYDNVDKLERLAPVKLPAETKKDDKGNIVELPERIELRPIANSADARKQPVLNSELLSRLYTWGVVGEKFFDDHPTDMEIVIKNGVIHPVQARPINRPDLLPTYLDTKKIAAAINNPVTESIRGEVMVPGKASVVVVTNPNQIRFAPTLEQAETEFLVDKEQIVIVTQPEPANSHPVVNFSGLGIPCLFMDEKSNIQELIDKATPDNPVVVCVQTGTVRLWDGTKGKVDDFVSKGFTVHPAKIANSFSTIFEKSSLRSPSEVPQEVKDLLLSINVAETHEAAMNALDKLRSHEFVTEIKNQRRSLEKHAFVHKSSTTDLFPKMAAQTLAVMTELDNRVDRAFSEVESAFKRSSETERLRPLFHTKVLESLLIGKPEKGDSLGQYSKITLSPYYTDAKQLILYQKKFNHPVHFADIYLAGNMAFDASTKTKWFEFLEKLELQVESGAIKPNQVKQLKTMIQTLEKRGLLATWFAFFFKGNSIEEILTTFPAEDAEKVEKFLKLGASIQSAKERVNAFSDSAKFAHAWSGLKSIVEALTIKEGADSINEMLQNASPMGRLVILNTMQDAVDLFDTAIKQMKGSPAWSKEDKVPIFRDMLDSYFTLLESWVGQLKPGFPGSRNKLSLSIPMTFYWSFDTYLNRVKECFRYFTNEKRELQSSFDFSVAASIMGAQTEFSRHMPRTLEDFFTLVHQNLLGVTSNLKDQVINTSMISDSALPVRFKKTLEMMEPGILDSMTFGGRFSTSKLGHKMQKTGFEVSDTEITVKYNIPLRNHSAQMVLKYDKATEKTTIQGYLLGPARSRWEESAFVAQLLDATDIIHLDSPVYKTENELKLTWEVKDPQNLTRILKEFGKMCTHSLKYDDSRVIMREVESMEIDPNKAVIFAANKLRGNAWEGAQGIEILKYFIRKEEGLDTLLTQAEKLLSSEFSRDFIEIFSSKLNISTSFGIVNKLIANPNPSVRTKGFDLLQDLIRKNHHLEDAIPLIRNGIGDPDTNVQQSALNAYRSLTKKINVDEILLVTKGVNDTDPNKRRAAMVLLEYQIIHNDPPPLQEALEAAIIGSKVSDPSVVKETFKLFENLVWNKTGFNEALAFALSKIDDPSSSTEAFRLVTRLFNRNLALDEMKVLNKASEMFFDTSPTTQDLGLTLLQVVLQNRKDVPEFLINVAKTGVTDQNTKTVENSLVLFKSLAENGQGIDEALKAANTYFHHSDPSIAALAYNIMTGAASQGKYDEDMISAVKVGLMHSDPIVQDASSNLYKCLVQKNYAPDALANMILESVNHTIRPENYNPNNLYKICENFNLLIRQSPHKDATFEMVKLIMPFFSSEAIVYLKNLARNGYSDEVISYAQELLADPDINNKHHSFELFYHLAEYSIGIDAAVDAIAKILENPSYEQMNLIPRNLFHIAIRSARLNEDQLISLANHPDYQVRSLFLDHIYEIVNFRSLNSKEAQIAAKVAKIFVNDLQSEILNVKSLELISRLLEEGFFDSDDAFAVAKNAVHSPFVKGRSHAASIMYILSIHERTHEKHYEESLATAKVFLSDSYWDVRLPAVRIFRTHMQNNRGFEEAIAAASEGVKSNDISIMLDSLDLFREIVERGHGFEEAAAALEYCKNSPLLSGYLQSGDLQYKVNLLTKTLETKTTFLGWVVNFLQHGFQS